MSTTTLTPQATTPTRARMLGDAMKPLIDFHTKSIWAQRQHIPGIADFTFGDPHEMPLSGLVTAIQHWSAPDATDWFAYKMSESRAQEAVALSLTERLGVQFHPQDIAMTTGGFGAISTALKAVTNPGDEVVFSLPAWPLYEAMIREAGLVPVKANVDPITFDLDLDSIANAITPRTRIVVVNTPHNPTGKIYPADTLAGLSALLEGFSIRNGAPIYILSDEPYNRIVFDDQQSVTPARFYPRTLLAYSYGKVLLAPGQRIGYLAMPAYMPGREQLRQDITVVQVASGWTFPNALLQHALPDLEALSIDIGHLEQKRDRMIAALQEYGYELYRPAGTFYLMVRAPQDNDEEFVRILAEHDVFVIPGSVFETPGYFRISLTASDEMIDKALPVFEEALEIAHSYTLISDLVNDGW